MSAHNRLGPSDQINNFEKSNNKGCNSSTLPVINTIYCLSDSIDGVAKSIDDTKPFQEAFQALLPMLNFSSTCYQILAENPCDKSLIHHIVQKTCFFLKQNTFLQLTFRPVHPFSADDNQAWFKAYQQFLTVCRPFQAEGYREQIISRLRIFPVIFFSNINDIETALPFLKFLKKNFFLPSILFPQCDAEKIAALNAVEIGQAWERIYLTDTTSFEPEKILDTLIAHQIFDHLAEDEKGEFLKNNLFCYDSLALDLQGRIKTCLKRKWETDHSCLKKSSISMENRSVCNGCLQQMMAQAGKCFQMNQEGHTWNEICDRIAGNFLSDGQYNAALNAWDCFTRELEPHRIPVRIRVKKALCYYEKADLDQAMAELAAAREYAPESAEIRYYMGLCEFGWRDYIEAADRFQESIQLGLENPMRQEAHYFCGLSHYHLEEFDEALPALKMAGQEGRADSTLFFYQGLCRLGKEEYKSALANLREALKRGPAAGDLFSVLFYLAYTHKEMEDFSQAISYCDQAIQEDPNNKDIFNLKGFCYFKTAAHDAAIQCFERVLEIDPKSAIDYANIGSNLREKGEFTKAIAMYRKALALDNSIDFARENIERLENQLKTEK